MISGIAKADRVRWSVNCAVTAAVTEAHAPASYRGSQTTDEFLRAMGNIWIGLIERIAADEDQEIALAGYFGISRHIIQRWIDARGRTRCTATLPDGRRCAVLIGQGIEYDPRRWADQDQRCASHASQGPGD